MHRIPQHDAQAASFCWSGVASLRSQLLSCCPVPPRSVSCRALALDDLFFASESLSAPSLEQDQLNSASTFLEPSSFLPSSYFFPRASGHSLRPCCLLPCVPTCFPSFLPSCFLSAQLSSARCSSDPCCRKSSPTWLITTTLHGNGFISSFTVSER